MPRLCRAWDSPRPLYCRNITHSDGHLLMTAPMLISLQTAKAAGVQLKNLRSCQSRDGEAWSASVYFQGKKVGTVCDQGYGGPVDYDIPDSVLQTIRTGVEAAGYIAYDWQGKPYETPLDLLTFSEFFFADLSGDTEWAKRMRPKLKTKTILRMKDAPEGEVQIYSVAFSPEVKERLCARHGGNVEFFLNEKIDDLL